MNNDPRINDIPHTKQRVAVRALVRAGVTRGATPVPQAALPYWRLTLIDGRKIAVFPSGMVKDV